MSHVMIRCINNNHSIQCSTPITGVALLKIFDQEHLTLASIKALKDGSAHRSYRFVGRNGASYDLTQYEELYTPDRQLLARIEEVSYV